jgi:hypothetical protein
MVIGPASQENWHAFQRAEPALGIGEHLLHTDADLTGDTPTGTGPYTFFNLIPQMDRRRRVRAGIALRLSIHTKFDPPDMSKTDQSRYHGGTLVDELAALVSLVSGIRLRSGATTREFQNGSDPMGRPTLFWHRPEPTLVYGLRGLTIPELLGDHSLSDLSVLSSYPDLPPSNAIALIRAARLYQDALWFSESEPSMTWLLLVSATETIANVWRFSKDSPADRLRASRGEFVSYLETLGTPDLVQRVAAQFSDSIGATKKFVDFLIAYQPGPPPLRPDAYGQVEWSDSNLKTIFRLIYEYRSRALHDGQPFPAPMCDSPQVFAQGSAPLERPIFLASSGMGGVWLAKDIPILLHTFEYVVRRSILSWWSASAGKVAGTT